MHLGARHQLAAQRRRQLAVGDILGAQLKSELFSELDIYEEAVEKEKQDAYDKRMYERALNGLSPTKKKAVSEEDIEALDQVNFQSIFVIRLILS